MNVPLGHLIGRKYIYAEEQSIANQTPQMNIPSGHFVGRKKKYMPRTMHSQPKNTPNDVPSGHFVGRKKNDK